MMIFMSHFSYGDFCPFDAGGDCGVAFFFLLSGFTLSMGYGQRIDAGTFCFSHYLTRRLYRIYPLHLLCLALFLLLFRPDIDSRLLLNALLLQSWIPEPAYYFSYNAVSWFLSSLLPCYLLFPLACRYGNRLVLAVVLVCCLTAYWLVPYDKVNALLYVSPWMRFVDFFLGIMLFKLYHNRPNIALPVWTELLIVVLLVMTLWLHPYVDAKWRNAPLYWFVLLPLIFVFARQSGPVSRLLQHRWLQWLASLSMPIFLLHPIVFRIMFHFFPSTSVVAMWMMCFITIVALSWLTDRLLARALDG